MKICVVGKYFSNAGHGAECGIIYALEKLGHQVCCMDFAANKVHRSKSGLTGTPLKHVEFARERNDFMLVVGPGLPPSALEASTMRDYVNRSFSVLWNSEPIRLPQYMEKFKAQAPLFNLHCTFDEGEIPLYLSNGAKKCVFLPQAYNPAWYKPLPEVTPNKVACFVGSIGGKWCNRESFLQRAYKVLSKDLTIQRTFNAETVNKIYNQHCFVLNLGLHHANLGPPIHLASYAFQQRIFETIGAGAIPITNRPADLNQTPQQDAMFTNLEDIIYYDNESFEAILKFCISNPEKMKQIHSKVLESRSKHTYENRMDKLTGVVQHARQL
jgi:spore maturation protein CgeB